MADSASDPKVEDVLSSVRRLVSGEIPRKERTPLPKGPGALVLTDAHRVQKDPAARTASRSLEDRIAELEAAVDGGTEEFEPDGSEDQTQNVPDRIVYTRPPRSEEEASMRRSTLRLSEIALIETGPANEGEDKSEPKLEFRHDEGEAVSENAAEEAEVVRFGDNGGPNDGPELTPYSDEPEAPMAEDVPTLKSRRADVTVFTNPDDVVERIEARIDRSEDDLPVSPIGEASDPDAADAPSEVSENMLREDVASDSADSEEDFDAALKEAVQTSITSAVFEELVTDTPQDVAGSDVQPEDPPVTEMDDLDLEAVGMSEFAADSEADPRDTVEEDQGGEAGDIQEAAALLNDENAFRELVGRLIREELQGELGERITRNVRKLVRREVKRALDSRDIV